MEVFLYVLDLPVRFHLVLMKARVFVSYVCFVIMILAGRPFTITLGGTSYARILSVCIQVNFVEDR